MLKNSPILEIRYTDENKNMIIIKVKIKKEKLSRISN